MAGATAGRWDHERYLTAVEAEARRCAEAVALGGPAARVPSCPDWDLAELCRHLGSVHRWVTLTVRTRAQERPGFDALPDPEMPADAAGQAEWLLRGALTVVGVLREAGPDLRVWGWAAEQHTGWWARRMAHETLVHRIDAELASGPVRPVDPSLAADGIDELLHNALAPAARAFPRRDRLRGEGGTLHLHCTDVHGEWTLRRTPQGFAYEPGHGKGDAALRGPAGELMTLLTKRLPGGRKDVELFGDEDLVALWLDGLTLD